MSNAQMPNAEPSVAPNRLSEIWGSLEKIKIPGLDMNIILDTSRKDVEALIEANERVYRTADELARRQLEQFSVAINEWQDRTRNVMTGRAAADRAHEARHGLERLLADLREVADLVAKSNEEIASILQNRAKDSVAEFRARFNLKS